MANTYTWTISALDAYPTTPQPDCVFNVHWQCVATSDQTHVVNGQTMPYTATIYSTQGLTYIAGSPYTPYAQLTQQQVLGWIWAGGVSETGTQTALDNMIANQINPTVISPALPWSA